MSISLTEKLFYEKYDFVINIGIAGCFVNFKNGDVIEVIEKILFQKLAIMMMLILNCLLTWI